jgi:hypothetical protein
LEFIRRQGQSQGEKTQKSGLVKIGNLAAIRLSTFFSIVFYEFFDADSAANL